jgi:hypothetical protein
LDLALRRSYDREAVAGETNARMNELIRRRGRAARPPAEEPEPELPSLDLGAGPRPPATSGSDADAFRRWLSAQYHRGPYEAVTITARRRP